MTSSMGSQVQYIQNNMFTKTYSNIRSSETSSKSDGKDFSKVLSEKSEDQEIPKEPEVKSKDSEGITKKDYKKDSIKDEKNTEINETGKSDVAAEEEVKEVDTLLEELIQLLQSDNIMDMDKLKAIFDDFQEGSISIDELKPLLEDLKLSLESNPDLNLSKEVSEKFVELVELLETVGDIKPQGKVKQVSTTIDNSQSDNENLNQLSNEGSNQLSDVNPNQSNEKIDINDEGKNINSDIAETGEVTSEDKTQENPDAKVSVKDNSKAKDLFAIGKKTNDSTLLQRDIDLVGVRNIEVEAIKDYDVGNIDKTLPIASKPDMDIFNQVLEGTKITISEDVSEMVIKLKPDNLGKLSMKIVIDRGMLVAKFDVESQMVKEAIESNLEDLRNALKDKGFEIQQFDVSVNKDSDQSENHFGYFNKGQRKKISINNDIVANDSYVSTSHNPYGLTSTINYLG